MTSEQQIAANQRNARKSTGPRLGAGKQRASSNAYRHGLAAPIRSSEAFANQVDELARKIAGDSDSVITLARARAAAEAELDLVRVRHTKVALIEWGALHLKARGLRGERIRAPKPVKPADPMPSQEPERSAEAMRRALPELVKLDRYERRASSRRDRAIRELCTKK